MAVWGVKKMCDEKNAMFFGALRSGINLKLEP